MTDVGSGPDFSSFPPLQQDSLQGLLGSEELEYQRYSSREKAKERFENDKASALFGGVAGQTLRDLKLNPPAPIEWTIEKLAAKGSIIFSLGTFKSGKSSLVINLLRCLADQEPFLGLYSVREISGSIGYFDFEMGTRETFDRLVRIGCINDDKLVVFDMAGEGFDLMADTSYEWLKRTIAEHSMEVIVLDALRHIANRKDGNSDSEAQRIINRLERLKKECPTLEDIFIPAHTAKTDSGRVGDDITVLGSAAWDGAAQYRWGSYRKRVGTDWKYWFCLLPSRRTDADASVARELNMDADGLLTLQGGGHGPASPKALKHDERRRKIESFVAANEPTSKNQILKAVKGAKGSCLALVDSMHGDELLIDDKGRVWTWDTAFAQATASWQL